jgi:hypothetical protein
MSRKKKTFGGLSKHYLTRLLVAKATGDRHPMGSKVIRKLLPSSMLYYFKLSDVLVWMWK